jgi:hypothetical protein
MGCEFDKSKIGSSKHRDYFFISKDRMMNPIYPYPLTPDGIREYQDNEPYPIWDSVYDLSLSKMSKEKSKFLNKYLKQKWITKGISFEKFLKSEARHTADWYVHRGTMLSWSNLQKLIWIRDEGICDICKIEINSYQYNCGHIVDQVCQGTDRLVNLAVMCKICNQWRKPLHETKEEYILWRDHVLEIEVNKFTKFLSDRGEDDVLEIFRGLDQLELIRTCWRAKLLAS